MAMEPGMTMRRRYQGLLRNGRPISRNAIEITASWPSSTPALNDRSAEELRARQAELGEDAGEAHAVEEAEREDDGHAPGREPGREDVLDGHVDDRQSDQRLDDLGDSETTP